MAKIIMGLYRYIRNNIVSEPKKTILEMKQSLKFNPLYRENVVFLAGDDYSASILEKETLKVTKVFNDAPIIVKRDTAHKMKHWMVFWALKCYGEVLWVDWDTYCLKWPDKLFWNWCRKFNTPKFLYINNYWAKVNCSVYYVNKKYLKQMEQSFNYEIAEPNDELMWVNVLPNNVLENGNFWFKNEVVNIWNLKDINKITSKTYFVHLKTFNYVQAIKKQVNNFLTGDL